MISLNKNLLDIKLTIRNKMSGEASQWTALSFQGNLLWRDLKGIKI